MPKERPTKAKFKIVDNDAWITVHFEEIVDKYAGQHIIVSNGEIFTGENALENARKKYPNIIPTSMPVPRPEDFTPVHIFPCIFGGPFLLLQGVSHQEFLEEELKIRFWQYLPALPLSSRLPLQRGLW